MLLIAHQLGMGGGAGAARPTWTLALPAVRLTLQIDEPLALAGPIEQPLRLTRTILET